MGVGVYGTWVKENESDEERTARHNAAPYFRRNWWGWRPLWDYVYEVTGGALSDKHHDLGHYNCGRLLNNEEVKRLATRLRAVITSGAVERYVSAREAELKALPDEQCTYCQGTGERKDCGHLGEEWKKQTGGCNACHGSGKVRPIDTLYRFSAESVEEFCAFLEKSDGLTIF